MVIHFKHRVDKLADYILRDINDGSVYHDAFLHYIQVPGTDILVPIIFYIDKTKTHVDQQGRLCLEPVSFTLGIFKKEIKEPSIRVAMPWLCCQPKQCRGI